MLTIGKHFACFCVAERLTVFCCERLTVLAAPWTHRVDAQRHYRFNVDVLALQQNKAQLAALFLGFNKMAVQFHSGVINLTHQYCFYTASKIQNPKCLFKRRYWSDPLL